MRMRVRVRVRVGSYIEIVGQQMGLGRARTEWGPAIQTRSQLSRHVGYPVRQTDDGQSGRQTRLTAGRPRMMQATQREARGESNRIESTYQRREQAAR
jgi:hypothetical protein